MPIAALPTNTVRAIGSSQVLADSASLVKELIDNALDGRATAVFVEISTNALDIIQVKDNGHGIAPGDRDMLCRRYCTSKIRNLEDLTNVGGQSLGFRGEALASAAEMSGSLTISTRVEGEQTATSIKVKRSGGIESEEQKSQPVGTTVRVADFLKALPVRRQTALRAPIKLLSKIKKMLHAYALSRPSIRFSLKVLKAKSDKGNWMYVPTSGTKPEAVLNDAAIKVVGKKAAEQSTWIEWSSSSMEDQTTGAVGKLTRNAVYRIGALLLVAACDTLSVNNIGCFVSIDSRPVSCARGTLKQLINLYKSYLRSASSSSDGPSLVDPFLCMNIFCPPGSYDVNIEPAKDDVLFTDNGLFLKVIESFFTSVYGELRTRKTEDVPSKPLKPRSQGFGLLLARKPPVRVAAVQEQEVEDSSKRLKDLHSAISEMESGAESVLSGVPDLEAQPSDASVRSPEISTRDQALPKTSAADRILSENNGSPVNDSTAAVGRRTWNRNMYIDDNDSVDELHRNFDELNKTSADTDYDNEDALREVSVSNPWAIAKMNASIYSLRKIREPEAVMTSNGQLLTPVRQRGEVSDDPNSSGSHNHAGDPLTRELLTPKGSHAAVPSTTGPRSSSPGPFPYPLKAWGKGEGSRTAKKPHFLDRERYSSGALDTWVQKSMNSHMSTLGNDEVRLLDSSATAASRPRDFISARALPIGTPLSDIPTGAPRSGRKPGARKQQQSSINKPFVSPAKDPERVWFDIEPKRRSKPTQPAQSNHDRHTTVANTPIRHDSENDSSIAELSSGAAPIESMHPDLAAIMDYELRKQAALEHRKRYLRQQAAVAEALNQKAAEQPLRSQSSVISPHKNRYHKAIAALHPANETLTNPSPSEQSPVFEPGDPRAYLIRAQQRENAESQIAPAGTSPVKKRRKTAMLPLETLSNDRCTRDLTLKLEINPQNLKNWIPQVAIFDNYVRSGNISEAFPAPKIEQVRMWEAKLRALIRTTHEKEADIDDDDMEMRIDLWPALQTHLNMHVSA